MISLDKFITSFKHGVCRKRKGSRGENERTSIFENQNEAEGYDELTNKEEIRDKYMIYIYILYNLFGILFVIIRHRNGQIPRIMLAYGGVRDASGNRYQIAEAAA